MGEYLLFSTTSFPMPDLNLWSKIGVLSACCWVVVLIGFVIQFGFNMLLASGKQRRQIGYFGATGLGILSVIPVSGLLVVIQAISGNGEKNGLRLPALMVPPFIEWRIDQSKSRTAAHEFRLELEKQRFAHISELRSELLRYALKHDGQYPGKSAMDQIDSHYWKLPASIGGRYEYRPGLSYQPTDDLLVSEPDLGTGERWSVTVAGVVVMEKNSTTRENDVDK